MFKKYSPVFIPMLSAIFLLVLIVFSGNFFIDKIREITEQKRQISSKLKTVEAKIAALESAANNVKKFVSAASYAVPEKNSSLMATSQIRKLAAVNNILLDSFIVTADSQNSQAENQQQLLVAHQISFVATGAGYNEISGFVMKLNSLLPLLRLDSIEVSKVSQNNIEAKIRLSVFSAPYPKTLTLVDEYLGGLTESEQGILTLLETYNAPEIDMNPNVSTETTPRENPFLLSN